MFGVPVRPPSGGAFATSEEASLGDISRPNQLRAQFRAQIWRGSLCHTVLRIGLSSCLLLALSGCVGGIQLTVPPGSAELKALSCSGTSLTGSGTDTCTVTLNAAAPAGGITVTMWTSTTAVTVPAQVTIAANATSARVMATVSPVTTAQAATLTATVGSVSKSFVLQLNVNGPTQGTPTINWAPPAAITYGTALSATQLDASSTVAGTFSYSPAIGTVLNAGVQILSVTFTPTDTTDYATATTTVALTVNQAAPVINWTPPAAITYGTALSTTQLDATSTVAGTFTYIPSAGVVLNSGAQTLWVTFTPTDSTDYAAATAAVALTVDQATPVISWTAPAAITYGTALSATQLDASSTVAGTFTYNPAAGTVLKAGVQTLSVTFTPTDTADYPTATATVALTVNRAAPAITWPAPSAITDGTALSGTQLDASSTVAGTFSYSPAAGTVLSAGVQTLSVTFTPTDGSDYSTATATVALTVSSATPTISWAAPAAITYGTALSGTQLDASSTVAGTFAYTPAAGTVLKAGVQTLSVTFTPTDTADYTTATATVALTVNRATPPITWPPPAAIADGTALSATQLDASSTVAGAFTYTPAAGTVLKAGPQTLSVTFTPTDSTDYSTATATVTLTVNSATPTISWPVPAAITYGTALSGAQLDASSTVAGTFAYTPAPGAVLKAGTQTLSVAFTPTDTTDYTTATATVALTVNQATPAISWTTPAAITYGTALSNTQLDASSTVAGTFAYSPAAGTVLSAGVQTLSVTFTPTDSTDYKTATASVSLTVKTATQSTPTINWATPAAITYGTALSSTQLDASSSVAGTFGYTPAAGTVLKAGSQTLSVTFTPTDTTDYSAATATVILTVNQATPTITWATPAAITYGTALSNTQLDASSSVAGTFAYAPAAGTVLSVGAQPLSVTFTPTDTTDYKAATASVTLTVKAVTQSTPAITWAPPAAITYGTALSTTQLDASTTVAGTFAYTPAAGTVLKAGTQTLSVTFTPTDTTDYTSATASVSLTVNQAMPVITWATPAAITYGTALSATQLDASSTVAGTFAYAPAAGTVLNVGAQPLSVTFTPTDTADYKAASATVTLTVKAVTQSTPAITWAAPAAITYGTALSTTQLNASTTVAGTFAYTPAAGTVLKAGAQTLSVTFTPTDTTDYTSATASVSLTVNQATPTITWATPAGITYGTALSATQLDASSTTPGAFVYSPAAGAVPPAGSQTLSVTFTPTDTTDYTAATQTVTLTVNAGTSTLSINATSVGFGNVVLNTPSTQTVILSSTGTASVTVNSAVLTGTGFTMSGPTFPATLTPGQTATLELEFDPTALGAATGQLTVTSTSSTGGTAIIPLTGTGTAATYAVDLSWDAPTSSEVPVTGYNVYRALNGSSTYQLLTSSVDSETTYTDNSVESGQVYDYIVESVDASGVESAPTSPVSVTIP